MAATTGDIISDAIKRDVSEAISKMLTEAPTFISFFPFRGEMTTPKHEWMQDVLRPVEAAYTSSTNAGVFTFATAALASTFSVGDIVTIKGSSVLLKVTAVSSATVTTSFESANGSSLTSSTIPLAGGTLTFVTHTYPEGSATARDIFHQSSFEYNYSQISRACFALSDTLINSDTYGNEATILNQSEYALFDIQRELNRIAIFGRRVERVKGSTDGSAGGLYEFGTAGDGGIDATVSGSASKLSIDFINEAAQDVLDAGGIPDTIVCHPAQRRVLSKLLDSYLRYVPQSTTRGTYVDSIICDSNGRSLKVFCDASFPQTDVWVIDSRGFSLIPYRNRWCKLDVLPKTKYDGKEIVITSEFTFEFRNAASRLRRIYNLMNADDALSS